MGVELFGSTKADADVEVISLLHLFLESVGIRGLSLSLNSIGCPSCRAEYNRKLKAFVESRLNRLCEDCNNRYQRNPLRILDCKEQGCINELRDVPYLLDYICGDCAEHFEKVKEKLAAMGIPFTVDKKIVRGLDYYNRTVFEFVSKNIGSQGTVCGGGRYDGLIESVGGSPTPGIGFALGIERLLIEMDSQGIDVPLPPSPDIFIGVIGDRAGLYAENLALKLRTGGIICHKDIMERSVTAQMKYANKLNARFVVIIGDNEVESGKVELKDMSTGETRMINIDTLQDRLKKFKQVNS